MKKKEVIDNRKTEKLFQRSWVGAYYWGCPCCMHKYDGKHQINRVSRRKSKNEITKLLREKLQDEI